MISRWAALFVLPLATPAAAQTLAGGGVAYNVEHRILYQGAVREQTGLWTGGEGSLRLGPVRVGLGGVMGTLSGGTDPANPERKVRSSVVTLLIRPARWVELGAEAEARRFESDIATTVWRLAGPSLRISAPLGPAGLAGTAHVSYFPLATVTGDQKIALAFRGSVGVSLSPPRVPITAQVAYRFERFDFAASAGGSERLEQFRGVTAGLGFRLGRP